MTLSRIAAVLFSLLLSIAAAAEERVDLAATISVPADARAGEERPVVFTIVNRGTTVANDVVAHIYAGGAGPITGTSSGYIREISGTGWVCGDPAKRTDVVCRTRRMAPGEQRVLIARVVAIDLTYAGRTFWDAGASVTLSARELVMEPYGSTQTFFVRPSAAPVDLGVTTQFVQRTSSTRAPVDLVATVTNHGATGGRDLVLRVRGSDQLPPRRASGAGWSCRVIGYDAICTRDALGAGQTSTVTFEHYAGGANAHYVGTVVLTHGSTEPNWSNNEVLLDTPGLTIPNANPEDFEPVLLPVAWTDIRGENGSLWRTEFTLLNGGDEPLMGEGTAPDLVYPYYNPCPFPTCATDDSVPAGRSSDSLRIEQPGGHPGVLLWVRKDRAANVAYNLRVRDLSRENQTWGTEVPVVAMKDLFVSTVRLPAVPLRDGFRQILRIYDVSDRTSSMVTVRFIDADTNTLLLESTVTLVPRPADGSESPWPEFRLYPNYFDMAHLADMPQLQQSSRVHIEVEPQPGMRTWAFVSLTHNETQHVTLVTPQEQ